MKKLRKYNPCLSQPEDDPSSLMIYYNIEGSGPRVAVYGLNPSLDMEAECPRNWVVA